LYIINIYFFNNLIYIANDIDYEEFTAPEWCIPIKANVIDFEWDVSIIINVLYIMNNYYIF